MAMRTVRTINGVGWRELGPGVQPAQPPVRIGPLPAPEPIPTFCPGCTSLRGITLGDFHIDHLFRRVLWRSEAVDLGAPPTEFELLWTLARWRGGVVPHRTICETVWPDEPWGAVSQWTNVHRLRVNFARIRNRIDGTPMAGHVRIFNVPGIGYALRVAGADE